VLTELAKDPRIRLVAINYKDKPENAAAFLAALGNPYAAIGVDERGRTAIDWGVYGVPETFLVGPDGVIRQKFIGPLTDETVADGVLPAVEKALTPAG
jgi:cytochrome c biogenesis protein CcmG/thiol:disulfide interchange protein DsbE